MPERERELVAKAFDRLGSKLEANAIEVFQSTEKNRSNLSLGRLPEKAEGFQLLTFFGKLVKSAVLTKTEELHVGLLGKGVNEFACVDALSAAVNARIFDMPLYGKRAKDRKPFHLKRVVIYVANTSGGKNLARVWNRAWVAGDGGNFVRYLGTLPPNELNPKTYAKRISDVCSKYKFAHKFYSAAELKRMGAGAFTAVDQGNPNSHGGIHELTYSPRGAKNAKPLVLVGKGLCFDTGGYDIKTGGYMISMKGDMQGSALALATLIAAAELKWPIKIKAFLGVTENLISPVAFRADEVVTALNGVSIEVINTDAEGRMVLADTLCLASRTKPALIVDYATLTGAATIAIGMNYSAAFTNEEKLHDRIRESGKVSGERMWTFPMDPDYGQALESPVADTAQCAKGRGPDHIHAAVFLSKFVEKGIPWVHVDLAAADRPGGLAHVDTLFTGFGVRWSLEFLQGFFKLKAA